MPAYLGTLGRLIPIRGTAQPVERAGQYRTQTTLEGAVKAQRLGAGRRAWAVSLGLATREQIASLWGFDAGEWGPGPFVWVTPEAQETNLLTPAQASCDPRTASGASIVAGGPLLLPGGTYAGRSFLNSNTNANMTFGSTLAPVIPGQMVTASAYLVGASAKVGVSFYRTDGTLLSSAQSAQAGTASAASRSSVTTVVPANAAGALVYGAGAAQGARPALTWTPTLRGYGPGGGCPKAIVDDVSRDPRLLTSAAYRADASFTVQEVG